jgi:hypothetical protein
MIEFYPLLPPCFRVETMYSLFQNIGARVVSLCTQSFNSSSQKMKSSHYIIEKNVHNFTLLNGVQKFIYLLCSENTVILNAIGKFIMNYICNEKLV